MKISARSPKPSQYHFCVSVTPKTLAISIFQSKGIQSLYKLQIDKGSKKQASEITRRNLHEQALKGFYKSQKCYFTLSNYTNLRPYEMKITFSQIRNPTIQQQVIFNFKFSTLGIVKNFLENGVRRSTHVVTIDYETEFYIDLYIQSNKNRLEEKVKLDDSLKTLKKRYVQESEHQSDAFMEKTMNDSFYEKNSDVNKRSLRQIYSPLKSSRKNSESLQHVDSLNLSFTDPVKRLQMPQHALEITQKRAKRRNLISNDGVDDSRSQRVSHSRSKKTSSNKNLYNENFLRNEQFLKKSPSARLSIGEFELGAKSERKSLKEKYSMTNNLFNKPSQQISIRINQLSKQQSPSNNLSLLKENQDKESYLQLIYHVSDISVDEVEYKIKRNFWLLLFVLFIILVVSLKAFDVANLDHRHNFVKKNRKNAHAKVMKYGKAKQDLKRKAKVKNNQVKIQLHNLKKNHKFKTFNGELKSF